MLLSRVEYQVGCGCVISPRLFFMNTPRVCFFEAQNVDINRCLVATEDWKGMLGVMAALLKRFGSFAKFKNMMSTSPQAAAAFHHLRLMMVSVQYDTGMTFGELCKDEQAQTRWEEYRRQPPATTVPGGRWCRQVETALRWIHSPELTDRNVILMCEVQCVLRQYRDVRLKMHEVYKVHRADDCHSLYSDFKQIRVDRENEKRRAEDGAMPELQACRDDDSGSLRMLVEVNGGELNNLCQCLMVAARHGSVNALSELVTVEGAGDAIVKNSFDCLNAIVVPPANFRHKVSMTRLILSAKADVDATTPDGKTSLYRASALGHVDVVRTLVQAKANVDAVSKGRTGLMIASQRGHVDVVRTLVQAKANVDTATPSGKTSLYVAANCGHVDVVCALLEAKADVDATSLDVAKRKNYHEILELLEMLK